ncbi:MAG: hypothetical protein BYD32DRAFT_409501 [Podila humilis]|nr:MAG: hypothetical protein BYD32DRAFT_409501 [Podila humilis]
MRVLSGIKLSSRMIVGTCCLPCSQGSPGLSMLLLLCTVMRFMVLVVSGVEREESRGEKKTVCVSML